jgi:hypothetical protein
MTDITITSATPGDIAHSNDNFDSRIWRYAPTALASDPSYSGLFRGYIESSSTATGGQKSPTNPQGSYSLSFLYNPSTVSVSHSLSASDQMYPPYLRSAADTGIPLRTSGGTVGFSLLFDRTYEVWDGRVGDLAHDLGVLLDVHVLYGLTGITTPLSTNQQSQLSGSSAPLLGPPSGVAGSPYGTGATSSDSDVTNLQNALSVTPNAVTGTMQMYPVWAVLAGVSSAYSGSGQAWQTLPDISLMRYFGYIEQITVDFTHFTQRLIPFRCAVGITIQLMASAGYQ